MNYTLVCTIAYTALHIICKCIREYMVSDYRWLTLYVCCTRFLSFNVLSCYCVTQYEPTHGNQSSSTPNMHYYSIKIWRQDRDDYVHVMLLCVCCAVANVLNQVMPESCYHLTTSHAHSHPCLASLLYIPYLYFTFFKSKNFLLVHKYFICVLISC